MTMNPKCVQQLVKDLTQIRKQLQTLDGCDIAGIESNVETILMLIDQSLYGLGCAADLESERSGESRDLSNDQQEQSW